MSKSKTIGTVRTGLPAAWATLIAWLVARFGFHLSEQDYAVLVLIIPAVIPVFYRIAREIETRWPAIGRILFGSTLTPTYGDGPAESSV